MGAVDWRAGRNLFQAEVAAPVPNGLGGTQEGVDINRSAGEIAFVIHFNLQSSTYWMNQGILCT